MEDFETIRKGVEPLESDENNIEIFAPNVTVKCDISVHRDMTFFVKKLLTGLFRQNHTGRSYR